MIWDAPSRPFWRHRNGFLDMGMFCSQYTCRDSPTVWCLCALFPTLYHSYVPFNVKKEKMDNSMCLLESECAKRLKAQSRAIPVHDIIIQVCLDMTCEGIFVGKIYPRPIPHNQYWLWGIGKTYRGNLRYIHDNVLHILTWYRYNGIIYNDVSTHLTLTAALMII